jgi:hypothetical protein
VSHQTSSTGQAVSRRLQPHHLTSHRQPGSGLPATGHPISTRRASPTPPRSIHIDKPILDVTTLNEPERQAKPQPLRDVTNRLASAFQYSTFRIDMPRLPPSFRNVSCRCDFSSQAHPCQSGATQQPEPQQHSSTAPAKPIPVSPSANHFDYSCHAIPKRLTKPRPRQPTALDVPSRVNPPPADKSLTSLNDNCYSLIVGQGVAPSDRQGVTDPKATG